MPVTRRVSASCRRGGVVRVGLNGDRILLSGRAVSILKGEIVI